jgi:hypothetical protein
MGVLQYWTAFAAGRGLAADIGPEFAPAEMRKRANSGRNPDDHFWLLDFDLGD